MTSKLHQWSVVIAAAGKGSRSGLDYPKTLFPIQGQPILVHLYQTIVKYDKNPKIIVSPKGWRPIANCLNKYQFSAELIEQPIPKGMGDAVLQIQKSAFFSEMKEIILVWGDIPFLQPETLNFLIQQHLLHQNDLSIATAFVEKAYTRVLRNERGEVLLVEETRQMQNPTLSQGERDVGLFIFKKDTLFPLLKEESPLRFGRLNQEHGFLYLVELAVSKGYKVGAYPCATHLDLISFNQKDDIKEYL